MRGPTNRLVWYILGVEGGGGGGGAVVRVCVSCLVCKALICCSRSGCLRFLFCFWDA